MKKLIPLCFLALPIFFTGCYSEYDDSPYPDYASESYTYDEKYTDFGENPFVKVSETPVSTFGVDADGGSYANMRRFLNIGQKPPVSSVRIEEYINYFTFNYKEPTDDHHVALNGEISTCPWNQEHALMRLGMKGKTIPENELPSSNYVLLIDVSGSMNSPEKLGILKSGFKTMADNMKPTDRIAIVIYAGSTELHLPSTYCDQKETIKNAIDELTASGSTAGSAGIDLAYKIAEEYFIPDGNNRVIIGTDGDFNVGKTSTDDLIKQIEIKRELGIYLTVLGVGGGNLNEAMMEQVANKGNGNYEYIDNANQIQKVFNHEVNKFYTVAKDSKIQITFNPNMVDQYRLIGYENRVLQEDDFENDTVDAGEIGSSQTITALYELILSKTDKSEQFAAFDFRYKKLNEETSTAMKLLINGPAVDIDNANDNMRFAASVTAWGLLMKESEYKGTASKAMVLELGNNAINYDPNGYRSEFLELVKNLN